MKYLLVVAAMVGCYSPSYEEGSACTTACPGDLLCVNGFCRAPGSVDGAVDLIDTPPGDGDGDGVLDNVDNCAAVANADQHDEDLDAIGDLCDPCPHLSGTAADADGDGVGDACDPQPMVAKQSIKFFDPFTSDKTEWQHGGGISRLTDQLRSALPTGFTRLHVSTGELRIVAGGSVTEVSALTPHHLQIAFGHNAGGDDYYYGQFYDPLGAGGNVNIMKVDTGTYMQLDGAPYGGKLPTGAWSMQIDESVAAQTIAMTATLGGLAYGPLSGSASPPALIANDAITFYARNIDVRVDYLLVIETAP